MSLSGYAIDLGGTKTAAARIEEGRVIDRLERPTDPAADLQAQLRALAPMLAELGYRFGDPLGVAVAGRVDSAGNRHAVNTGTLRSIPQPHLEWRCASASGPMLPL